MLNRGLDKLELLRIVEAVANEKSIDKELVIGSMESAIQKAALTKFVKIGDVLILLQWSLGGPLGCFQPGGTREFGISVSAQGTKQGEIDVQGNKLPAKLVSL